MFLFDAVTTYLLSVALATLLVAVLVWQPHRSQRTIIVWLASGAVGVLLGSVGSYAGMRLAGYVVEKAPPPIPPSTEGMHAEQMSGMGGHEMEGMHHEPGMGKVKGMGVRGAGGHKPRLCLTMLVQKLDLLTGDIGITLTAEQAAAISSCLKDVEKPATMSDNDARAKRNQLAALLNENQKARLNAIELPPPESSGGPGSGPGMPGMSGGAAPKQDEPQNPFQDEAKGKALKSLRERLGPKATAPKAETSKAPPAKTEPPNAPPPKADAPKNPAAKS